MSETKKLLVPPAAAPSGELPLLIVIGASAGGPGAVRTLLEGIDPQCHASFVVVQHVDAAFSPQLIEWWGQYSPLPVQCAEDGALLAPGTVYVAGGPLHLTLSASMRFRNAATASQSAYRPSIDTLFQSVSQHWRGECLGILLTGMGTDGAMGLAALRKKGCTTLAQGRESCAVYGMPKAAADAGAACEQLEISAMAPRVMRWIRERSLRSGFSRGGD